MEVPLTKRLQGNCVGLFKYLILLFFRNLCTWLPRNKQGQINAPQAGVRCLSEQSPKEEEEAGKGGDLEVQGSRNQLKHSMLVLTRSISCRKL